MDNMLVIETTQKEIDEIKRAFTGKFKMSNLSPISWYLGLKITCDFLAGKIFLSQALYVEKILECFGMQQGKGVDTPMVKQHTLVHASKDYQADNSTKKTWYYQVVGFLMYAMTEIPFDIVYAVFTVSQFASNFTSEHVAAVKKIFRYLRKYSHSGITISQNKTFELERHVDSDWAMDPNTRRSTTKYLFTLAGGLISALSKRQYSVNLSSTEAEYIAYCEATKEAVWLRLHLKELGQPRLEPTILHCDNNSAILLANNPEFHARTKHIDTQVH